MKISNHLHLLISVLIIPISACGEGSRITTKVTVIEENGIPVEDAQVHIGYPSHQPSTVQGESGRGTTNEDGEFSFTGAASWKVSVKASKEGHYDSLESPDTRRADARGIAQLISEIDATLTLREIRNPVPMYVRRLQIRSPITEEELGFDFFANDWVSPYGSGEAAHVYIKFRGTMDPEGIRNLMTWRFPNEEDGILRVEPHKGGSRFVWPYLAPTTGYRETMRWQYTRPDALAINDEDPSVQSAFEPAYWIFRFNTVVDENGQILSANYGKFYGSLFINGIADQPGHPGFAIQRGAIYVNPEENERSMEFDTTRNLAHESLPPYALLRP